MDTHQCFYPSAQDGDIRIRLGTTALNRFIFAGILGTEITFSYSERAVQNPSLVFVNNSGYATVNSNTNLTEGILVTAGGTEYQIDGDLLSISGGDIIHTFADNKVINVIEIPLTSTDIQVDRISSTTYN